MSHLMIASVAASEIHRDAARALSLGLARPGQTITQDRCDWNGNHIDDCDCGMDEGD
jgi:hypothetical protein